EIELGRKDIAVARPPLQRFTEEALRRPAAVDVGRVDKVDAHREGFLEARTRLACLDPDAISQPRAERDFRDLKVAVAELAGLHAPLRIPRPAAHLRRTTGRCKAITRRILKVVPTAHCALPRLLKDKHACSTSFTGLTRFWP